MPSTKAKTTISKTVSASVVSDKRTAELPALRTAGRATAKNWHSTAQVSRFNSHAKEVSQGRPTPTPPMTMSHKTNNLELLESVTPIPEMQTIGSPEAYSNKLIP
jgi:hypothetical protein